MHAPFSLLFSYRFFFLLFLHLLLFYLPPPLPTPSLPPPPPTTPSLALETPVFAPRTTVLRTYVGEKGEETEEKKRGTPDRDRGARRDGHNDGGLTYTRGTGEGTDRERGGTGEGRKGGETRKREKRKRSERERERGRTVCQDIAVRRSRAAR